MLLHLILSSHFLWMLHEKPQVSFLLELYFAVCPEISYYYYYYYWFLSSPTTPPLAYSSPTAPLLAYSSPAAQLLACLNPQHHYWLTLHPQHNYWLVFTHCTTIGLLFTHCTTIGLLFTHSTTIGLLLTHCTNMSLSSNTAPILACLHRQHHYWLFYKKENITNTKFIKILCIINERTYTVYNVIQCMQILLT